MQEYANQLTQLPKNDFLTVIAKRTKGTMTRDILRLNGEKTAAVLYNYDDSDEEVEARPCNAAWSELRYGALPREIVCVVLSFLERQPIVPLALFQQCTKMQSLTKKGGRGLFQVKCAQGLLAHARWLIKYFRLTSGDVRANNGAALRFRRNSGHTL